MKLRVSFLPLLFLAVLGNAVAVAGTGEVDAASLVEARSAVERVYYEHRTGTKKPFEEAVPAAVIERKVRLAVTKEGLLKSVYGVEVTPEMVGAEVVRIDGNTRAPEMLAEIKAALGNEAEAFAEVFARPLLVERELRARFDNDDARHAGERGAVEKLRERLLTAGAVEKRVAMLLEEGKDVGRVGEMEWQLGERPVEEAGETVRLEDLPPEIGPLGPGAKILSSPGAPGEEETFYLEDLNPQLRRVLAVQLTEAGAVSAVIEAPTGFLLYVAKEKTDAVLGVVSVSVRKADYGEWVEEEDRAVISSQ